VKVAVVGAGRTGREVESVLRERGHEPVPVRRGDAYPAGLPVGIDFTAPEAVTENVARAVAAGSRYVVGTTGWEDQRETVQRLVEEAGSGLVHAANFSLGVNLFYRIVRQAAALLARFPEYDPYVLERHHRGKRDAPSGTARALVASVEEAVAPRLRAETDLHGALSPDRFHVASVRAGGIVGDHTVGFDSGGDEILLEHRARSRKGFALGAVLAAEWIVTRQGLHSFDAVLAELLQQPAGT
jgi:4-hydroxy-tetrahydrodipicolinate reductase